MKGVVFRLATDVNALPGLLAPFDRIVVATGAGYRFGLGGFAEWLARPRSRRAPGLARLFASPAAARLLLLSRARAPRAFPATGAPGQKIQVIGDAVQAGKSKPERRRLRSRIVCTAKKCINELNRA